MLINIYYITTILFTVPLLYVPLKNIYTIHNTTHQEILLITALHFYHKNQTTGPRSKSRRDKNEITQQFAWMNHAIILSIIIITDDNNSLALLQSNAQSSCRYVHSQIKIGHYLVVNS